MIYRNSRKLSLTISVAIHSAIALIFMAFTFTPEFGTDDFVTIGFGSLGKSSASSLLKNEIEKDLSESDKNAELMKDSKSDVAVPKVKNADETNEVSQSGSLKADLESARLKSKSGSENDGVSKGKFGFDIDFGGKGIRKIYSYFLPSYPEGVSKEIDVKLRFTILPDGTVGRIIPLLKADSKLESAAINSLRQWRFEPLPQKNEQKVQSAVIVFPFRLQ
ncbi:MAG: energy transducer TonB [Bacteroidetes bacterium]|nr:energy transducer TonB [Bacteroidota bacterium]MBU1680951.1 energy transducer TonB [Bacteroidota bacterium]MBU2506131.1 energy transducer TonB [Bacteroidota bacterium]